MANDDKNKDKEQDDFFGDDEDFGLPELDYEALDDDDSDDSAQDKPVEEETPAKESVEEESVSADDDSVFESESMDDMDDLDDMGDLDDEDIPDQVTDEELEASLADDDLSDDSMSDMPDDSMDDISDDTEVSDEAMDEFYEEESFDDFEAPGEDEDGEDIPDSIFDSDVLDEDEFAQFEKELMDTEEENVADMSSFQSDEPHSESKSKFAKVVIFGIIIFAALGAIFWFMSPLGGGEEEAKPVAEKVQKPVAAKPEEKPAEEADTETESAVPENTQPKTPAKQPATTRPKQVTANPGTVNALTSRTGNSFIVIGSFLDGDMAMDYANKLASQGKSPSIIPPFGNAITHRVAISGYPTFTDAQGALAGFRAEYGQDIWILKY